MPVSGRGVQALSELDRALHRHVTRQTARLELATVGATVEIFRLRAETDRLFAARILYRLADIIDQHQAAVGHVQTLAKFLNSNQKEH